MVVTGGVDNGESAGSRRNSLNAERRRQGGGGGYQHHQQRGEQKIKSSNSWDALRQHDAESNSEESQEEFEDAKEKLHRGDRDRAGGEETNNNNNNNNDAIGLGEEEEELRRKQRRKEKKKLRRLKCLSLYQAM